jgi:hypothetical protein
MPAQAMKLSVLIGGDASGLKAGGVEAQSALDKISVAAAVAGKSIQELLSDQEALGRASKEVSLPAENLKAYGAQLDALRAKYDPIFAATQRYETEIANIKAAHQAGALSADVMTQAMERERREMLASVDAISRHNTAVRSAAANDNRNMAFNTANIAAQFQDIAVTSALGMAPLQIALQQGTQLSLALETAGGGLRGALAAIGTGFGALLSPISLVTIGLTAAAAAAIGYFTSTDNAVEKSNTAFEQHAQLVKSLAADWGNAVPSLKAYADELERATKLQQLQTELQNRSKTTFDDIATGFTKFGDQFPGEVNLLSSAGTQPNSDLRAAGADYANLQDKIVAGTATEKDFTDTQAALRAAVKAGRSDLADFAAEFDRLVVSSSGSIAQLNKFKTEVNSVVNTAAKVQTQLQDISQGSFIDNGNFYQPRQFTPAIGIVPTPDKRPSDLDTSPDKSAADERIRQSKAAVEEAQYELSISGQSLDMRNRLIAAYRAEAQIRQAAAAANQPVDEAEVRNARARAAALADINAQLQAQKAIEQGKDNTAKLKLEISLIGAAADVRARSLAVFEAELRIRELGLAVGSKEAQQIRDNAIASAQAAEELAAKTAQATRERQSQNGVAAAQYELSIAGESLAMRNRLIAAYRVEAQIRETAAAAGRKADETEIANARAKAAAIADINATLNAQKAIEQDADDTARLRLEASLIGASADVRARSIAALEAEQKIKQLGIDTASKEAQAIRASAQARADLNQQLAAGKIAQDQNDELRQLQLQASLIGASAQEQARANAVFQVEQQLRQQGIDLLSKEADARRQAAVANATYRAEIERQQAAYQTVQDAGSQMIDQLTVGTTSLKDSLKNVANTLLQTFQQLAIANPLKNALLGTNLPTIADLFSGKPASPAAGTATGTMTVTAATVIVNGTPIGTGTNPFAGATATVPGLAAPSNPLAGATATVSRILPAANQNTDMSIYQQAISKIESGSYAGNYSAVGPTLNNGDYAIGRYQIMASNVPSWSQKYLGQTLTPQQALANPAAQDAMFNGQFGSYLNKYGNQSDAASAWFTGGPLKTGALRSDVNGTTGNEYVNQFNANVQKLSASTSTAAQNVSNLAPAASDASKALTQGDNSLVGAISKASQTAAQPAAPAAPAAAAVPGAPASGGIFSSITGIFGGLLKGISGLFSSLFKGVGSIFGSLFGGLFAKGDVFSSGAVIPFANGTVIDKPTLFPMAGGRTGLMAEAGEEAIMPLRRGADGKLGVVSAMPRQTRQGGELRLNFSSTHNVNLYGTTDAELRTQWEEGTRMALDERDRQWRDNLPNMIDDYRLNPHQRMVSV